MKTGDTALTHLPFADKRSTEIEGSLNPGEAEEPPGGSQFGRFSHQLQLLSEADAFSASSDQLGWRQERFLKERLRAQSIRASAAGPGARPGGAELGKARRGSWSSACPRTRGCPWQEQRDWPFLEILLVAEKFKVGEFVCSQDSMQLGL